MDLIDFEADGLDRQFVDEVAREFGGQFSRCPSLASMRAAREGLLPGTIRERLDEHVAHCAACATLAADIVDQDEAPLQPSGQERIWARIRSGMAEDEFRARTNAGGVSWWKRLLRPMPLALVSAAAVLATIGVRSIEHRPTTTSVAMQGAGARNPVPPAPDALILEKPSIVLPAPAVLVWRGADSASGAVDQLREALAPFEAERYADAAGRLKSLTVKYPNMPEARFYLGVCQLFLGLNSDAAATLKTARSLAPAALSANVQWYLALAYHRDGKDSDARPLLETLCRSTGEHAAAACAGLPELR